MHKNVLFKRSVIAVGFLVFIFLITKFILPSTASDTQLKTITLQGILVPYEYSDVPEIPEEIMLTGNIVAKNLTENNPNVTIATAAPSVMNLIKGKGSNIVLALGLEKKETMFAEHTEENQKDFTWKIYSVEQLNEKLVQGRPITAFFRRGEKYPYVVFIHSYV